MHYESHINLSAKFVSFIMKNNITFHNYSKVRKTSSYSAAGNSEVYIYRSLLLRPEYSKVSHLLLTKNTYKIIVLLIKVHKLTTSI